VEVCRVYDEDATSPAVAYGDGHYLVVWHDTRNGGSVFGARVAPPNQVEDPDGFRICGQSGNMLNPDVACSGSRFLVVYDTDVAGQSDVYGIFVEDGVPATPFAIAAQVRDQWRPRVAFNGSLFLVAWNDKRRDGPAGAYDVRCSRVAPDGTVLDPEGIPVTADMLEPFNSLGGVASDGVDFLVGFGSQFTIGSSYTGAAYAAVVSGSGEVGDPVCLDGPPNRFTDAAVPAFGDGEYLLTWGVIWMPLNTFQVCARSYNPSTTTLGPIFLVGGTQGENRIQPSVCGADGIFYIGYQSNPVSGADAYARRAAKRCVLGDELPVWRYPTAVWRTDIATDGNTTLMVWEEDADQGIPYWYAVYADTIGRWQGRFWTQSPFATAFNPGRHLARDPVTGTLHLVYTSSDSIFYSFSTDGGDQRNG